MAGWGVGVTMTRFCSWSRIAPAEAGSGEVTGTWRFPMVRRVGYELSWGGTVVRLSSTWNGSGKGKDGAAVVTREVGENAGSGAKAVEVESL